MKDNYEIVFTKASLLDLLTQIEEFDDFDIGLTENIDGELELQVGESHYLIADPEKAEIVNVDDSVVDELAEINETAYDELAVGDPSIEKLDPIESGLIKETLKTLLIGGVVRMGKKYLKD